MHDFSMPIFLLELFDPWTGESVSSDITRFLENAVDAVYWHLADFDGKVTVEVSRCAENGEIEGIGFFDEDSTMLSSIAAYYLDRDSVVCETPAIATAVAGRLSELESKLCKIFRN